MVRGSIAETANTAGNLVQKEDYQEITDSAWQDAVRDALDGETGLYRTEQSGVAKKRKDNVNRIWDRAPVQGTEKNSAESIQGLPGSGKQTASVFPSFSQLFKKKRRIGFLHFFCFPAADRDEAAVTHGKGVRVLGGNLVKIDDQPF